jgi:hypothetical protein
LQNNHIRSSWISIQKTKIRANKSIEDVIKNVQQNEKKDTAASKDQNLKEKDKKDTKIEGSTDENANPDGTPKDHGTVPPPPKEKK